MSFRIEIMHPITVQSEFISDENYKRCFHFEADNILIHIS